MNNKLRFRIIGIILSFFMILILSGVITFCLLQIFLKQPELMLTISTKRVIESVTGSQEGKQIFVLTLLSFMLIASVSILRLFNIKNYYAKTYEVTPDIKIPVPVRKADRLNMALFGG